MPRNATKKRRLTKAERRRIRRQQFYMKICVGGLIVLCLAAVALMPLINTHDASIHSKDIWYAENGEKAAATDHAQTQQATLTTIADTPEPSPEPTAAPDAENFEVQLAAEIATQLPEAELQTAEPVSTTVLPEQGIMIDATATPKAQSYITITAVGDCTLGGEAKSGGYGEARFKKVVDKYGYDYFLANFRELFEADDITIVNLEGPLTESTDLRSNRQFNFRGDPEYVNILSGSSVEICSLANNHALDFGKAGFEETAWTLDQAGIGASGYDLEYYTEVNGYTVGSLSFTEWDYEADEIAQRVSAAREKCDLLLVSVHWGEELAYKPSSAMVKLGHKIVDAGADLVIGNHSHVYGPIEQYNGKYILYSLGNFCFGGSSSPTDPRCIVFQQSFCIDVDGSVTDAGINIIPARVSSSDETNNFQPIMMEADDGKKLLSKVAEVSNLTQDSVVWMEGSYVSENGIIQMEAGEAE